MDEPDNNPVPEVDEQPYLRRQKPVEVRRSRLRVRTTIRLWKWMAAMLLFGAVLFAGYQTVRFVLGDSRFRLEESAIDVSGVKYITRRQVAEKFAGDIGRSVFVVPLARRQAMVEEITWVESAAVARVWPNGVRVAIRERVPVAFLRNTSGLYLVDRHGVIMERPNHATFSFPVLTGVHERDPAEQREQRMRLYLALMEDLDRDGGHYTLDVSEVNVSDPEDARLVIAPREGSEAILVHLGNANFLSRYRTYLAHIRQWRQQFEKIQSIDLRYEKQIIINPDRK